MGWHVRRFFSNIVVVEWAAIKVSFLFVDLLRVDVKFIGFFVLPHGVSFLFVDLLCVDVTFILLPQILYCVLA